MGGILAVGFPVTIALAELPTYLGYVIPRLQASTGSRVWIVVVVGSMAAAQHITMPLMFDAKFILWRLLMFVPLSLFWAWAVDHRPTLLPHMMVLHGLLDMGLVAALLLTALGLA